MYARLCVGVAVVIKRFWHWQGLNSFVSFHYSTRVCASIFGDRAYFEIEYCAVNSSLKFHVSGTYILLYVTSYCSKTQS